MEVQELTVRQAEDLLTEWGVMAADRDARVLTALASRVSKRRISALTGLARSTIDSIEQAHANGGGT